MIGEYGVGKSSLFRRFTTNSFVTATDRTVTLGLDNYGKVFEVSCYLKAISFVNSVCTIFSLRKKGTLHQTFQSSQSRHQRSVLENKVQTLVLTKGMDFDT